MRLLQALQAEAGPEQRRLMVAAGLVGITNALLLVQINAIAQTPNAANAGKLFLYVLSVLAYVANARYTNHRAVDLVEAVVSGIKVRVSEKLARIELDALERMHAAEICDRITENALIISDRAGLIAAMLRSAIIVLFALVYIAWLEPAAFVLVALVGGIGAIKFLELRWDLVIELRRKSAARVLFFDGMTDLLAGLKELQFGKARRDEVTKHVQRTSENLRDISVKSNHLFIDGKAVADVLLFAVLAAIVYDLQRYSVLNTLRTQQMIAAVMFTWGSFADMISGLMPYVRSNLALEEILALEAKLESVARGAVPPQNPPDPWKGCIRHLRLSNIEYNYPSEPASETFHIGPVNFQMQAGEVIFVVGGNGSGKSTLVKVLTGLYAPTAGLIEADGIPVGRDNIVAFRDNVTAIFSDAHLFAKLYGLAHIEERAVRQLIARMRLEGQTSFERGSFTNLNLSTGQRKRIAMVVALLEGRPICVFDEWAADQDPEFRRYFYDELLPVLRDEGKMVVVVSHDDRYFDRADRIVTMEYGSICSIEHRRSKSGSA